MEGDGRRGVEWKDERLFFDQKGLVIRVALDHDFEADVNIPYEAGRSWSRNKSWLTLSFPRMRRLIYQ